MNSVGVLSPYFKKGFKIVSPNDYRYFSLLEITRVALNSWKTE